MVKISELETKVERFRRERDEKIKREYLEYSELINSGQTSPNRIILHIGTRYNLSRQGVKNILQKIGVYKSAAEPVVIS